MSQKCLSDKSIGRKGAGTRGKARTKTNPPPETKHCPQHPQPEPSQLAARTHLFPDSKRLPQPLKTLMVSLLTTN